MYLRSIAAFTLLVLVISAANGQQPKTKNIIIVTLDGFRWNELYTGADHTILSNKKYVKDEQLGEHFWSSDSDLRRQALMPFLWKVVSTQGQLYGNRNAKNKVNCTNHHLLSYPGYNEMLVGYRDRKISSNKKINNPNSTVLEFIHEQPGFNREVAAFATWDAFPFILREKTSDIYVNAGLQVATGNISRREKMLNDLQTASRVRSDSITFQYAFEYLKRETPRVTFIGFDETDHHAHGGRYDEYLKAASRADNMIAQLWDWVQSHPAYRNQTTLFITTDHGRGNGKNNWRKHRLFAAGSRHIWFAVIGPDTPAFGEMKFRSKIFQNQAAKTIAAFLGLRYENKKIVGEVVQTMLAIPKVGDGEATADNRH